MSATILVSATRHVSATGMMRWAGSGVVRGLHKSFRSDAAVFVLLLVIRYGQCNCSVNGGLVKILLVHSKLAKSCDLMETARMCQNMMET